ncbi:MAG: CusA/CzcA family heavy metal efflux RND transporter [Spirochaetia bacterium]|nr:CusA/CzcA family heavy metal efflux RND transporter [Spirochaetia bacterium]
MTNAIWNLLSNTLRNRAAVLLVTAGLAIVGVYSGYRLPIDALPDITNTQVTVNANTGALSPEQIETDITAPIEAELSGLPKVEEVRSLSKYGLSQVTMIFEEGMDPYFARQLVSERLSKLVSQLPPGVSTELGPLATGLGEVMQYAVIAKPGSELSKLPETERLLRLRTAQMTIIRPELKTVPGVEEVDTIGGLERVILIDADPLKMARYGIDFVRLGKFLSNVGVNTGGGFIEGKDTRLILRSHGKIESIQEIKNFPIRIYALGGAARIGDIANVHEGGEPRAGAATYHGQETVIATLVIRLGENSSAVSKAAREKLDEIALPPDIQIVPLYSQSYLIHATIRTVAENLLAGAALVIAILLLVLRNYRAAFIVALAIPLSMLFAATGMLVSGVSANLMSLGAVDFGLLVDASVVMVENIVRRLGQAPAQISSEERLSIITEAAREVSPAITAGIAIILIVYFPILALTGIEGKLFSPMARTVLLALAGSLLVALVLMPVLCFLFLKPGREHAPGRLKAGYQTLLRFSLTHRMAVLVPVLVLGVVAGVLYTRLGSNFIPALDETDIVLSLARHDDASLPSMIESQKKVEQIISTFAEVQDVYCKLGAAESNLDPNGLNLSDTFVILKKDRKSWPVQEDGNRRTRDELIEDMCKAISEVSGSEECTPEEPIGGRFNDILEGSRADVAVRVFGPDLHELVEITERMTKILSKIQGVDEVQQNDLTALRESTVMDFHANAGAVDSSDVHSFDLNENFETAMAGRTVGSFYDADRRYPIILRLAEPYRSSVKGVEQIPIERPGGGVLPLGALGKIQATTQVTTISRNSGRRYSTVGVFLRDRDLQGFVDEAKATLDQKMKLPPGYRLEWGGQFKNLEKARLRLGIVIPVTLAVIFLVLLRSFQSLRQTIVIFLCVPFAVTGGILALTLRDIPMSIPAAIGFIALTGIAILNGTVLVSFFNQLRESGKSVRDAVEEGTLIRLRPVMMTALVASIGFLPMALSTGTGAEVQRPLATVVIGGLISATLLTLILLPTMYLWFEETAFPGKRK